MLVGLIVFVHITQSRLRREDDREAAPRDQAAADGVRADREKGISGLRNLTHGLARLGPVLGRPLPLTLGVVLRYNTAVVHTFQMKTADTKHEWYIVDAAGQRLGTLAVRVARALSGKHKPTWTPHIDDGDFVVVLNAEKVELGGKKWSQKIYQRHSGYPGGLKTQTAQDVREKYPERLIERAVRGMLPTNKMREVQLTRLKVYRADSHPHSGQKPQPLPETIA